MTLLFFIAKVWEAFSELFDEPDYVAEHTVELTHRPTREVRGGYRDAVKHERV
jgi:hypothetical protein